MPDFELLKFLFRLFKLEKIPFIHLTFYTFNYRPVVVEVVVLAVDVMVLDRDIPFSSTIYLFYQYYRFGSHENFVFIKVTFKKSLVKMKKCEQLKYGCDYIHHGH